MQEQLQTVIEALKGAWRFRWRALWAAWAIAVGGWVMVCLLPNQYQAQARVYVDTESVLKPLLSGLAVGTDVMPQVNMMTQALLSRPQLTSVARATDLYLRAKTPEELESLVEQLRLRIRISAGRGDNIYTITFADTNPNAAQRLVQELLDSFVENTLGNSRVDSSKAQQFLATEIRDNEQRLTEAEDRLADFKRRNVGMIPGAQGDFYARLQTAQAELEKSRSALAVAQNRRDEIRQQLSGEEPTYGIMSPSGGFRAVTNETVLDAQIAELQRKLSELSVQYTDKHPDIIAIREKIAFLEQRKLAERKSAPPPTSEQTPPLDLNPVYQSYKIDLGKAEVEVRTLATQVAQNQQLVNQLKSRVDTIPQVEAQLKQLNRDYDVTRTHYDALLARLESAKLTESAEEQRDDVRFRIIEPPVVPTKPIGPHRLLFLMAVLVLALAGGLGLAIGLQQLDPIFSTRKQLHEATNLPVLGVISSAPSIEKTGAARRDLRRLALATGMLLVCFGVTVLLANDLSNWIQTLGRAGNL